VRLFIKFMGFLACFALVSSLSGYLTFKVLSRGLTVEVPDVEQRSLGEATRDLEGLGLGLVIAAEEFDLAVPKGHVISQDIPPGSAVRNEVQVRVVVSKGPEVHLIPSFIGQSREEATKLLAEKRLTLDRTVRVHSETVTADTIIAQRPAPEEWTGESITLVASVGPYEVTYYCPFFLGMLKDDALLLAAELGLKVVLRGSGDSPWVVEQKPQPGEPVSRGGTVELVLAGEE
jgi:serine/threonine-protein kinase